MKSNAMIFNHMGCEAAARRRDIIFDRDMVVPVPLSPSAETLSSCGFPFTGTLTLVMRC